MNLVETLENDKHFDQPCAHGCRVAQHAVYCHSSDPMAPRKCRRTWYTAGEIKDEDCPFYQPNKPLYDAGTH